jgi:endonuclease YncB( thermonuclease family)
MLTPPTTDYNALRTSIRSILDESLERAKLAIQRERVRAYWRVGRELDRHLPSDGSQAEYGARVIPQLATDVGMSDKRLYESLKFYRYFPNIRALGYLPWSLVTRILSVLNDEARTYYVAASQEAGWSFRELSEAIRTDAFTTSPRTHIPSHLQALRGDLNVYRVRRPSPTHTSGLYLDLGFSLYWRARDRSNFEDGTVVRVRTTEGGRFTISQVDTASRRLFTHRLDVTRIIDGDTIAVTLTTPTGDVLAQKLRFRGIDTAELPTEAGHRAKRFVERALTDVNFIVAKTTRPDRYDRYLADIFYAPGEPDPDIVAREGRFLNGELLGEGLARRV